MHDGMDYADRFVDYNQASSAISRAKEFIENS